MCGYVLFVYSDYMRTVEMVRSVAAAPGAGPGAPGPGPQTTDNAHRPHTVTRGDGRDCAVHGAAVRSASRSAIMSAVQASRCGPGWGVQIPHPRPRCSGWLWLGRTGNDTLHVGVAGEPHPTRHPERYTH